MSSPAALPLRFDARVQLARHPSGRTRSTMFSRPSPAFEEHAQDGLAPARHRERFLAVWRRAYAAFALLRKLHVEPSLPAGLVAASKVRVCSRVEQLVLETHLSQVVPWRIPAGK